MRRAWYILRRSRFEADLDEEMEFHRAMKQREIEARGADPADASLGARRALGSGALARDHARDVWIWPRLQDVAQDLRFAARLLVKDRGFTIVAVAVLGLGIGVDNTLFIFVNAACLRGLPIERPDRVLFVSARDARDRELPLSYRELEAARSALTSSFGGLRTSVAPTFSGLAAHASTPMAVGDQGRAPDRALGTYMSANAFGLLGERPILGRDFAPEDDRPGAPAVAMIGAGLWKARYGSDPSIVGRTIRINGAPSIVVGIMRDGFKTANVEPRIVGFRDTASCGSRWR